MTYRYLLRLFYNRIEFIEEYLGERNFTENLENLLISPPQNIHN